ncbi:MAG: hypothetical protein PUD73_04595 [bacterium]|nr:hypothetical protein [bacterium]
MDKRVPENDYCDLEPGKICDNCCRCIDEPGKEYNTVLAGFELLEEDYVLDDVNVLNEPLERPDIDPALLAEWEEKLRKLEEEEKAAEAASEKRRSGEMLLELSLDDD